MKQDGAWELTLSAPWAAETWGPEETRAARGEPGGAVTRGHASVPGWNTPWDVAVFCPWGG